MAAKKTSLAYRQAYVHGNTVRKTEMPVRREPQDSRRKVTKTYTVRRNREKALHMDLPYVFLLTVAAVCALYICVNYLHMQSTISTRIAHIEQLEKELEGLKSENDVLETRINAAVDLDRVYRIATEELGMVYANKKQVLLYDRTESEYVRQYEDIPKQ